MLLEVVLWGVNNIEEEKGVGKCGNGRGRRMKKPRMGVLRRGKSLCLDGRTEKIEFRLWIFTLILHTELFYDLSLSVPFHMQVAHVLTPYLS